MYVLFQYFQLHIYIKGMLSITIMKTKNACDFHKLKNKTKFNQPILNTNPINNHT